VFVALVSLADTILGLLPHFGGEPVTLRHILGVFMAPLVWLAGIPWGEAQAAGALMGTKTVLNELVAYLDLARLPKGELSERSMVIMTYALCGFANFGSLGILIGGLGTMVPERRVEIVALGPKSILSGTLATLLTVPSSAYSGPERLCGRSRPLAAIAACPRIFVVGYFRGLGPRCSHVDRRRFSKPSCSARLILLR
jgi:nucleoside permease NupC